MKPKINYKASEETTFSLTFLLGLAFAAIMLIFLMYFGSQLYASWFGLYSNVNRFSLTSAYRLNNDIQMAIDKKIEVNDVFTDISYDAPIIIIGDSEIGYNALDNKNYKNCILLTQQNNKKLTVIKEIKFDKKIQIGDGSIKYIMIFNKVEVPPTSSWLGTAGLVITAVGTTVITGGLGAGVIITGVATGGASSLYYLWTTEKGQAPITTKIIPENDKIRIDMTLGEVKT